MASKNATKVTIGGKTYTLSGNESEEYRNVPFEMRGVLLQLNLADDYFKSKNEIRRLQKLLEEREQDLADLKHELVATQMKLESASRNQQAQKRETK